MTDLSPAAESADDRLDRDAALSVLAVAVRAPSIHNTQPWRWRLDEGGLTLLADRSRQLSVADPDGHSLLVSCGAALHLTEVALAAAGWVVETTVMPQADDPDALAHFRPRSKQQPGARAVALAEAALRRRSDRRPFTPEQITPDTAEQLRTAASDPNGWIDFPRDEDRRVELAVAVSWADRVERHDEAYIAEMQHWLRDPEVHVLQDGVPLEAVPRVEADHPRRTDVPLRDFELGVTGAQLIAQDVDEHPLIAIVFTTYETPRDHLEAGRAMMRLMLEAEVRGMASCPLSQAVDFAAFRTRLQGLMGWIGYPQMMLRLGYPSGPSDGLVRTPRRPPEAVLDTSL